MKLCMVFIISTQFFAQLVCAMNFLVLGDWGGLPIPPYSTINEESTSKQMAVTATNSDSKFVVALGDNFYFTGVKNEFDKRFEETYSDVFNQTSLQVPWYVVAGNHDHYGNVSAQIAYQTHSSIWKFPNYWYSKEWSIPNTNRTMRLVMIDTILLCGNSGFDDENSQPQGPEDSLIAEDQWAWLENELKNSNNDYLLVGGHFPVWSISSHGPTQCLVDRLKPLLEEYKVSAYMCGHDHNLQYLKEDDSNVHYFVIGSANFINTKQTHESDVPENSSKFFWADAERYGGFGSVDVSSDAMTVTLMDSLGANLYKQTIIPRNL